MQKEAKATAKLLFFIKAESIRADVVMSITAIALPVLWFLTNQRFR
jgi:hypothetical protein